MSVSTTGPSACGVRVPSLVQSRSLLSRRTRTLRPCLGVSTAERVEGPATTLDRGIRNGSHVSSETPKRLAPTKTCLRQLFAHSGNRCAFDPCDHPLIDEF